MPEAYAVGWPKLGSCGLEDAKAVWLKIGRSVADRELRPEAVGKLSWGGSVASSNCG
jgi:hypothetical protein